MAKKKVNLKFLITLTAVVGGLALALFIGAVMLYSRHNASFGKRAIEAEQKGDFPRAAAFYEIAGNKDSSNKDLYIRAGDMYERSVVLNPAYMGKATALYRRILEMDPTYRPAVDRLLDINIAQLHDGAASPEFCAELRRMADQALYADVNNPKYQSYSQIATLVQWTNGAARSDSKVEKAIDQLAKLVEKNPELADGAFYLAQAQIRAARDLRASGQTVPARELLDSVLARQKAASAARPQDVAVQWRSAMVFDLLRVNEDRSDRGAEYDGLVRDSVTAARANVKVDDALFGDVQALYAMWLRSQNGGAEQIEKVYRDWAAANPHDARARYELANYLGSIPAKRVEAMELLSKPMDPDPQARGYAVLRARGFQRGTLVLLNNLRAQDAAGLEGKPREDLLGLIDADVAKIGSLGSTEDLQYLKLRGKSQMLHGNAIEAIKSFERGTAAAGSQIDLDLWSQLQAAYLRTGQTGTAQRMMEDLLHRAPGFTQLHVKLASLYASTNQIDKAREQVAIVQANPPKNDPALTQELEQIKVMLAVRGRDAKAVDSLPEATAEQKLLKGQAMSEAGRTDDAVRLYDAILQSDPAYAKAVTGMVDLCMQQKNRKRAMEVAQNAHNAKPENPVFTRLVEGLAAADNPDAFRKFLDKQADGLPEPKMRSLRKATLAMQGGDFAGAEKLLDETDKIDANYSASWLTRVELYIAQRRFEDAVPFVERAVQANADGVDGLSIRTKFAIQRNDSAGALKSANELVTRYGEFAGNWVLLGAAQQSSAQFREALSSYDKALQRQSINIDAVRGRIACLEALGEYAQEKSAIEQAKAIAPRDMTLRDLSLNWELHHGDPDLVVAQCEQILKDEPENAPAYSALGQAAVASAQSKYAADPAAALKLLTRARDVLREGMVKFGATPEVLRFFVPMANTLDALGDPKAAEESLREYGAHPLMKDKPDAQRELARLYERHGRAAEAEQALRGAYATSHQSVDVQLELAQFLLRQTKQDDALKVLADANVKNPRIENQRIEAMLGANHLDEAQKLVDDVYGANPNSTAGLFYRGLIHLSREQIQLGVNDLISARDRDPQNAAIQLWLARGLLKAGRTDQAASQLEDILRRTPGQNEVRSLLLDAYAMASPPRWEDFDRVVKEALAHPTLKTNPTWHQRYARGLAQRGQFGPARQEIAEAQKLAPNNMVLRDELVNILVQQKDWPGVIRETDQQLAAGYKQPFVYGKRGIARAGSGEKTAAMTEFDAAIDGYKATNQSEGVADIVRTIAGVLSPAEALSRLDRIGDLAVRTLLQVDIYGMQDDRRSQASAAQAALDGTIPFTTAQRAKLLRTAADAYVLLQQWSGARKCLEELVNIHPDDVTSLNDLAYLIATVLNSPVEAKPFSKRAYDLARSSGNTSVMDTHGWVLTQCGGPDLREAVAILQPLVDSNQGFTVARYHLAVAYLRQGGWQRAGEQLGIVQQQMQEREQNHLAVPDELKNGVPKALQEVGQKSGQAQGK